MRATLGDRGSTKAIFSPTVTAVRRVSGGVRMIPDDVQCDIGTLWKAGERRIWQQRGRAEKKHDACLHGE